MTCADCKHVELCKHNDKVLAALNGLGKSIEKCTKPGKGALDDTVLRENMVETKEAIQLEMAHLCKHFEQ